MKRTRQIILLGLVIVMLIPSMVMAQGPSDIGQSPYKLEIERLVEEGILNGYPDGTFRPEGNIKRGEFAKVLALALKLEEDPSTSSKFQDVKGLWHEGYIGAIVKEGLMIGRSEDSFDPENNISREELAVVLVRAFDLDGLLDRIENIENKIDDLDQVSDWARPSVILVNNIGLMELRKTEEGNMFLPKDLGDRQEVAKLTYELLLNMEAYEGAIEELKASIEELEVVDKDKTDKTKPSEDSKDLNGPGEEGKDLEKPEGNKRPSQADIVAKYHAQLSSLQASVESQLNSLIDSAWDEAEDRPIGEVYNEYKAIAQNLEASTDSTVSSIISSMVSELEAYGYDGSDAAADLYSQYESAKSAYY